MPEQETSSSFLQKAEGLYLDGGLPILAVLGGLLGICLMCACCLGRSIRKDVSQVQKPVSAARVLCCSSSAEESLAYNVVEHND